MTPRATIWIPIQGIPGLFREVFEDTRDFASFSVRTAAELEGLRVELPTAPRTPPP